VTIPCCEHLALTALYTRQFTALARYAVPAAVLLRIKVFWDVTPCSWVFALKQWRTDGGWGLEVSNPHPPEIPKALQNRAKLNPSMKTVKNC